MWILENLIFSKMLSFGKVILLLMDRFFPIVGQQLNFYSILVCSVLFHSTRTFPNPACIIIGWGQMFKKIKLTDCSVLYSAIQLFTQILAVFLSESLIFD